MQRILTRAFEARSSCHCAFCSPVRPGVARNVNTLRPRRRLQFGDVVTVVYGTVLGSAWSFNLFSKLYKSEALDGAIAGVLSETQALREDQEARLKALGYGNNSSDEVPIQVEVSTPGSSRVSSPVPPFLGDRRPSSTRLIPSEGQARRFYTTSTSPKEKPDWGERLAELSIEADEQTATSHIDKQAGQHHVEIESRQWDRVWDRFFKLDRSRQSVRYRLRIHNKSTSKYLPSVLPEARLVGKSLDQAWEETHVESSFRFLAIQDAVIHRMVIRLLGCYFKSTDMHTTLQPRIQLKASNGTDLILGPEDLPDLNSTYDELSTRVRYLASTLFERDTHWEWKRFQPLYHPIFLLFGEEVGLDRRFSRNSASTEIQNEQLVEIFFQSEGPSDLISRLTSFLLTGFISPSINTLNRLFILFLDLQWYQAALVIREAIADFFENDNEISDIASLTYYHSTQQDVNFDAHRARLMVQDGRATRLQHRRPFDTLDSLEQSTNEPGTHVVTRIRDGIVRVQHRLEAGWTKESFAIVVLDLLERGSLREAFAEIADMRASGFEETPEILEALLQTSVYEKNWDLAIKSWRKFDSLDYPKQCLTWYWMLQACAVCRQEQSFSKIVIAGQEEGALSKYIDYRVEDFLSENVTMPFLKANVQALRRLSSRIYIPNTAQRDFKVPSEDIITLPSLEQTLLVAYLQYAKLRAATTGWFRDHLGYLKFAESQFHELIYNLSFDQELLRDFQFRWQEYDKKLENLASICRTTNNIEEIGFVAETTDLEGKSVSTTELSRMRARLDSAFCQQRLNEYLEDIEHGDAFLAEQAGRKYSRSMDKNQTRDASSLNEKIQAVRFAKLRKQGRKEHWLGYVKKDEEVRVTSAQALDLHFRRTLYPGSPANIEPVTLRMSKPDNSKEHVEVVKHSRKVRPKLEPITFRIEKKIATTEKVEDTTADINCNMVKLEDEAEARRVDQRSHHLVSRALLAESNHAQEDQVSTTAIRNHVEFYPALAAASG